jgi:hypothetical protein
MNAKTNGSLGEDETLDRLRSTFSDVSVEWSQYRILGDLGLPVRTRQTGVMAVQWFFGSGLDHIATVGSTGLPAFLPIRVLIAVRYQPPHRQVCQVRWQGGGSVWSNSASLATSRIHTHAVNPWAVRRRSGFNGELSRDTLKR